MQDSADFGVYESMFRFDPEGFAALKARGDHEAVTTHTCPNGKRVVCVEKRKLHSGRDPELEAKRFVRNLSLDDIDIVVLLGYASGYVAKALLRLGVPEILVYEPSLDILRVGLCHTPNDPKIQILTSPQALEARLGKLFRHACALKLVAWPASARVLGPYFHEATELTADAVKRARLDHNTHHLRSRGWLNNYLDNLPSLARYPNLMRYNGQFADNPAIICSAGPSLNKNAPLLRELQDQCIIIAVNTAARALAQMGVKAHVIIAVESLNISSQLEDIEWLDECTAFLEVTGNPKAFELPFKHIVPITVSSSATAYFSERLEPGQTFHGGQSVANSAVTIASRLGCPGIVLIGQDLAYQNDLVYAEGTVFEEIRVSVADGKTKHHNMEAKQRIHDESKGAMPDNMISQHDYRPVMLPAWGNPSQEVQSNEAFSNFQLWFANASEPLRKEGRWIVNATEGGAHIPGWKEQTLRETIDAFGLDQPPKSLQDGVSHKLEALAKEAPLSVEHLSGELQKERSSILEVVRAVLSARGWVNSDPDGDVLADQDVSVRIGYNYEVLREHLSKCPLLQTSISQPLQAMLQRQQVNTFAICKMIEDESAILDQQIEATLKKIYAQATQSRAAS